MNHRNLYAFFAAMLLTTGCGDDGSGNGSGANCEGAKCDNANDDPQDGPARSCESLLLDLSGNGLSAKDIQAKTDAIAQTVLSGGDERCPMSVADIVEALRGAGCSTPESTFVSERSQILGAFTDYRSVTELECDGKAVFLHFPIRSPDVKEIIIEDGKEPRLGDKINTERTLATLDRTFPAIMAETESGVFNFYQASAKIDRVCIPRAAFATPDGLSGDFKACETTAQCDATQGEQCIVNPTAGDEVVAAADFRYFGNSMDFVALPDRGKTIEAMANALPGPVTTEADIEHSLDIERNCAVCHPNGGMTMRELESPWIHWEAGGHFSSPSTSPLVDAGREVLGSKGNGLSFEGTVKSANRAWNSTRIEMSMDRIASESEGARTVTLGTMMRPLLCTDEFNIDTSGGSPGRPFNTMDFRGPVLDRDLADFSARIDASPEAFQQRLADQDWRLAGFSVGLFAGILKAAGVDEAPRETLGTLTFLHRATIDHDYQAKLVSSGFIDEEMVNDVLSIDITRAAFSEERCGLVDVFDQVDVGQFVSGDGDVVADAPNLMRAELIKVLDGTSNAAERDLLANLQAEATDAKATVASFMTACNARPAADLQNDYVDYIAQVRKRAAHQATAMANDEASFIHFRFPGMNGFAMPDAMAQSYQEGLRFDVETCELVDHYPGATATEEPEEPEVPLPDGDGGPGELSCETRGCEFTFGAECQCDDACVNEGDCCDFDGTEHDGPAAACQG